MIGKYNKEDGERYGLRYMKEREKFLSIWDIYIEYGMKDSYLPVISPLLVVRTTVKASSFSLTLSPWTTTVNCWDRLNAGMVREACSLKGE